MFVCHELFAPIRRHQETSPLAGFSFSFSMYWVIQIHFQEMIEERKVLAMHM